MPYTIKHKSYNECLIEYVEDGPSGKKSGLSLTMIVLGGMAVLIGIDFILVLFVIILLTVWKNLTRPIKRGFQIELNRHKYHVAIKNTGQTNPKTTILPLDELKGLGFHQMRMPKKSKKQPYTTLFFKYDERVLESPLAKKSGVLERAKKTIDEKGGFFWRLPIRKIDYPTPITNARDIIAATDDWLGLTNENLSDEERLGLEEPEQEAEILRDFRDM